MIEISVKDPRTGHVIGSYKHVYDWEEKRGEFIAYYEGHKKRNLGKFPRRLRAIEAVREYHRKRKEQQ